MRSDLPSLLPLVCPRCRTVSERGRELHTLSLAQTFRSDERGFAIEGVLQCDNIACRRRYAIVDGVPLVVPDTAAFLRGQLAQVVEGELAPELEALLAEAGPDEEAWPHQVEHLSIYLDAHWGDRSTPKPDGPNPSGRFGMAAIAEKIRERASAPVDRAVELGCSVGRGLAELQAGAKVAVGVELNFGALRRARRLLAGRAVAWPRKITGRHYRTATAHAGDRAAPDAGLVCGDALDPPLVPQTFDRVCAFNLIDSVRSPPQLLSVLDGLLKPGGELLLSSPYTWQSGIVAEDERLGGDDPAGEVARRLRDGVELEARYEIEDEAELTWWLRRDARAGQAYALHYLRARKRA